MQEEVEKIGKPGFNQTSRFEMEEEEEFVL